MGIIDDDMKKIERWAKTFRWAVFDTSNAAQAIEKRDMYYTSNEYNYRRAYRALMRMQVLGIVNAYHANQHAPKLWWLAERDPRK